MARMSDLTRLFFATDLHGSEKCFLKFLNAGKFYKTNILIMGGDITGKLMIPIVTDGGSKYHATYLDSRHEANDEQELKNLEGQIRMAGFYPYLTDPKEMQEMQHDEKQVGALFKRLMLENVQRWVDMAEQRLKGSGISVYITGGNDDLHEITPVLQGSDYVIDPEEKVVDLNSRHQMLSTGWSNPTPWKTPRECSEEELAAKIEEVASQVKDFKNAVFNLHVPPVDSGLDTCPRLDESLKPMIVGGEISMGPGGSTAVRDAIEKYQPLLGLHGHIHESKGFVKIGRTFCVNPGSEYSEGILRGVIVDLEDGKVKNFLLTQG
jgi:Icc-related predicted phosphoesterase